MVEEVRNLLFSPDEVRGALTVMLRMQNVPFPADRLPKVELTTDADNLVIVKLHYARTGGEPLVYAFSEGQIAAALIMFCRREGIPIAQRAEKELQIRGDNLSLIMRIGQKKEAKLVPALKRDEDDDEGEERRIG